MQKNSISVYVSVDTNLVLEKNLSEVNDVISMFLEMLSIEWFAILRPFKFRGIVDCSG